MKRIGLSVPPTFIMTVDCALEYYDNGKDRVPKQIEEQYKDAISAIERVTSKKFGATSGSPPLILCVRAGAPLPFTTNIGMNDLPELSGGTKAQPFGFRNAPER
jgi:hypothetical protein